jgi:3-hydroxyacyl-[acyl-carrier-protein] dehydratase
VQIMKMIPHRYPFLLIDRVIDIKPGESAVGLKNTTINEPYFQGHFPGYPIMPGVLIVEAMAQTAAVLAADTNNGTADGKLIYFMNVDNARFRKPVTPGDLLRLHVVLERDRGSVWRLDGTARVGDAVVAEARLTAAIVDRSALSQTQ